MLNSERGSLSFRHGLVRESVYTDLPERTRQFIHLTCARHLRDSGCDALAVASHAREAITPGGRGGGPAAGRRRWRRGRRDAQDRRRADARPPSRRCGRGSPAWLGVGMRCVEVLSLVQRCTDALAVADRLLAYLDDDESAGRLEVALSRALWLTGRWEEAEERSRATLERPGLPSALRARLEALHALALSRVRSPAGPARRPSTPWRPLGPPRTGRAVCSRCTRSPRSRGTRAITGHRCRISGSCAPSPSRPTSRRRSWRCSTWTGTATPRRCSRRRGSSPATTAPAILPSLLYAQIWQDYNLARLDGAEAAARTLMTAGRGAGQPDLPAGVGRDPQRVPLSCAGTRKRRAGGCRSAAGRRRPSSPTFRS